MKKILKYIAIIILLWIAASSTIQRFKCHKMTETELFLHIPKSIIGQWDNCNK